MTKIVTATFKSRSTGATLYTGTVDAESRSGVTYPLTSAGRASLQADIKTGLFSVTVDNGAIIPAGTAPPSTKPAAPALSAPTGLTATASGATQINLAWSAVSGATGYILERSANGTTGWAQIATPSGTSYPNTGLTASTAYYYRVKATNTNGPSAASSTANATTSAAPTSYSQTQNGPANRFIYNVSSGSSPNSTVLTFTGVTADGVYNYNGVYQTNESSGSGTGGIKVGAGSIESTFALEAAAGGKRNISGTLTLTAGTNTVTFLHHLGTLPFSIESLTITSQP